MLLKYLYNLYKAVCVCPKQNDLDLTKAAPVLNSSKADSTSAAKPSSMALDDTEMRKIMEECKRLQSDMSKLVEENRQLKVQKQRPEQRVNKTFIHMNNCKYPQTLVIQTLAVIMANSNYDKCVVTPLWMHKLILLYYLLG